MNRWNSVFTRWHLRHAIVLAVLVRITMSALLLFAAGRGESRLAAVSGPTTALYVIVLTVTLAAIDRRRFGADDLMANLGYSRIELTAVSATPAVLLEIAVNAIAAGA
jgi:hypothetical protein